ncbi:hypothetical protein EDB19DRAFT_818581 [Suillus lakei]|nr:hypothetical protein EDB19DRAFT_818581 [Suillus lakei]
MSFKFQVIICWPLVTLTDVKGGYVYSLQGYKHAVCIAVAWAKCYPSATLIEVCLMLSDLKRRSSLLPIQPRHTSSPYHARSPDHDSLEMHSSRKSLFKTIMFAMR